MIISSNHLAELNEFDSLLKSTIHTLNSQSGTTSERIALLSGVKLEQYAADVMKDHASGTPFENTIECTAGQSFPDIVVKKFYGVEVKTTIKNHWKTTGNSVLESSRLKDVERIFMLFGKLAAPIEFRYRPYEECLSEVVVTHSPRYLIDMNLRKHETIFDKIEMPYDVLRKKDNPIREITNYYKKGLKKGDELWWLDQSEPSSSNMVIRIWSNLTPFEQTTIVAKAFAFFPELLSNENDKFSRLAIWLVTKQGIVCPNLRDPFTAGGRIDIISNSRIYSSVPRIIYNLHSNFEGIRDVLQNTSAQELSVFWNRKTTETNKFNDWINLVSNEGIRIKGAVRNEMILFFKGLV